MTSSAVIVPLLTQEETPPNVLYSLRGQDMLIITAHIALGHAGGGRDGRRTSSLHVFCVVLVSLAWK